MMLPPTTTDRPEDLLAQFSQRLKCLSMSMYEAMSQGGDHRIVVTPQMAEDVLAASALVNGLNSKPSLHAEIARQQQLPDAKPQ